MIPKDCKRLAEVDFPIAEVSRHAAREKVTLPGHPSRLHLWWARRPLASSLETPIYDPAPLDWNEVTKVAYYYLSLNAMTQPMQAHEDTPPFGGNS